MNPIQLIPYQKFLLVAFLAVIVPGARADALQYEYVPVGSSTPVVFDSLSAAEAAMRADYPVVGGDLVREPNGGTYANPDGTIVYRYLVPDKAIASDPSLPEEHYQSGTMGYCSFDGSQCITLEEAISSLSSWHSANSEDCVNIVEINPRGFGNTNQYSENGSSALGSRFYTHDEQVVDLVIRRPISPFIPCDADPPPELHNEDSQTGISVRRNYLCPHGYTPTRFYLPELPVDPDDHVDDVLVCRSDVEAEIHAKVRQQSSGCELGNPCDPITGNKTLT